MSLKKVKLGDVLSYEQPTKYIVESNSYNDGNEIPVLTAGKSFILGYTNEVNNVFQDLPVIIFDDFTTAIKYVDFPFKVKSSAMKILKADEKISDVRYLFHKMSTLKIDKDLHKRYWISKYSQIQIPLPPLPIQKQIAEILDKADALRKKDLELLKHYDALAQSLFIDMFGDPVRNEKGWNEGRIRDIIIEAKYGTSKPAEDAGTFPYLRMNNIMYNGDWDFSSLKYINLNPSEINKYLLKRNDVVFNRTNSKELVGKTAIYTLDEQMVIAGYLIRIRVNELGNPFYLSAYLNSKHSKAVLRGMCKNIIGMANINAQELQNIEIMIPPVSLQNQFAEKIKNIELQKEKVKEQIKVSENLFQALLQKMFS